MFRTLVWLFALLALWASSPLVAAQGDNSPTLCAADDAYNSTTVPYEFNNNAWGDDGSGESCLQVNDGGESWSVTSKWTGNPETVKSFPRMKAHPSNLPVLFWNVSNLDFRAEWDIYVKGRENDSPEEKEAKFDEIYLRSNAALDVFLSDDAENSTLIGPPIEIMIWFWYTPSIVPLGYHPPTPDTPRVEVDGMNFTLYDGFNDMNQHVFSWLAERNMTKADADYSALFRYIWQNGLLSGALWLGQLECKLFEARNLHWPLHFPEFFFKYHDRVLLKRYFDPGSGHPQMRCPPSLIQVSSTVTDSGFPMSLVGFEYMHAGEETVSEVLSNYTLLIRRDGDPDASTSSAAPTSTSSRSPTSSSSSSIEATLTASSTPTDAAATTSNPAVRLTPSAVDSGILNLFGIWSAIVLLASSLTIAYSF